MEIILTQEVDKLGEKNDLLTVRNGYALNYLIPQGLAVPATSSNKKQLAENLRQASHRLAKLKDEAESKAEQLNKLKLTIPMLVSKDGSIYGSITPLAIYNAIKELGVEVDRKKITVPAEIEKLGTYQATVNLHKEVKAKVNFELVEKVSE
jgi:large subunit ribosomal protein L9